MPSRDLPDDELRDIVREEARRAVRAERRSYGYGVVGLLGLPLLAGAILSGNIGAVVLAVLAVGGLTAFLLW
jgi:hypothetical protein